MGGGVRRVAGMDRLGCKTSYEISHYSFLLQMPGRAIDDGKKKPPSFKEGGGWILAPSPGPHVSLSGWNWHLVPCRLPGDQRARSLSPLFMKIYKEANFR
jgi:hypothetical protein